MMLVEEERVSGGRNSSEAIKHHLPNEFQSQIEADLAVFDEHPASAGFPSDMSSLQKVIWMILLRTHIGKGRPYRVTHNNEVVIDRSGMPIMTNWYIVEEIKEKMAKEAAERKAGEGTQD